MASAVDIPHIDLIYALEDMYRYAMQRSANRSERGQ